jgi:hypothetical protein
MGMPAAALTHMIPAHVGELMSGVAPIKQDH